MSVISDYETQGYAVVDDFLPRETALQLNRLYTAERDWEQHDQLREQHYQHVFNMHADCLPSVQEHYRASFGRSRRLEGDPAFTDAFQHVVKPAMERALSLTLSHCDTRCYRLLRGDYYRTHIDDYAGDVGLIYYLNTRWVWDWGGILHVCHDDAEADRDVASILPKFNRAVLINHKLFRFPHFISSVEPWAQEPRYTIIGFNRV